MVSLGVLVSVLSSAGCADDDCTEQSCDPYGGSASRKLNVCVTSGSGSTKDEFVLKDEDDKEFYTCSRPADDNTGCGVELISAKEAYCQLDASGVAPNSSGSSASSAGGTSSSSGSAPSDAGASSDSSGSAPSDAGASSSSSSGSVPSDAGASSSSSSSSSGQDAEP